MHEKRAISLALFSVLLVDSQRCSVILSLSIKFPSTDIFTDLLLDLFHDLCRISCNNQLNEHCHVNRNIRNTIFILKIFCIDNISVFHF